MPLNKKDAYEVGYWRQTQPQMHLDKYPMYLAAWEYREADSVLEIGCGPYGGFMPVVSARRKVAVDPLIDEYRAAGIFVPGDYEAVCSRLEDFETAERFDAVLCADVLDHGDLDFSFMPKLASFLKPGGRLYLHVHLRPANLLNVGHDHALKEDQLDRYVGDLVQVKREILPRDIDGRFCAALIGVWQSPL